MNSLSGPPVLSTPDTHILAENLPAIEPIGDRVSDQEICTRYEIQRTVDEIRRRSWRKVALQFPDEMLPDSVRIFQLLARGIQTISNNEHGSPAQRQSPLDSHEHHTGQAPARISDNAPTMVKLTVLADTSWGSCCVDEIAAEHVDADAVVHYGRACLSPTARLPVFYVFTQRDVDYGHVVESFTHTFRDTSSKIVLMADVAYAHHVQAVYQRLLKEGYERVFAADIIHDPASPIPNRTVPEEVQENPEVLKHWRLFHISEPPTSLLLTLSSRLLEIHIHPTGKKTGIKSQETSFSSDTSVLMRRRYGLVTSLATVSIWGILINTLSVKNYLHIVDHVKSQIAAAGKKCYMFVVGKLNAAKLANFSEVGGWVVIGCWESSLVDSKDFYKPVITPFELKLALMRDEERVWNGDWTADFQRILEDVRPTEAGQEIGRLPDEPDNLDSEGYSEDESAPPEFDLRTGKYVSQTRPMQTASRGRLYSLNANSYTQSSALTKRPNGDLVAVNGVVSPAAQFLRSQRTWIGLDIGYEDQTESEPDTLQEGRNGIARGYVVEAKGSRT